MCDFVQLIPAEAGTYSNDISSEKNHMPSIFLISLTKSSLFSHSKCWSSTCMVYFWEILEISLQINTITFRKELFWGKNAHQRQPFCLLFFLCGSVVLQVSTLFSIQPYKFLHRVADAQLNIRQPLLLEEKSLLREQEGVKSSCSHSDKLSCHRLRIS